MPSGFPLTRSPFTYVLDYGATFDIHMHQGEAWIQEIAEAPPHLLHVAHDTPFPSKIGPVFMLDHRLERCSPEDLKKRADRIAEMVRRIHAVGVKTFVPYICNQTLIGDPTLRNGIWEFFDHWDDYAAVFDIPPRPPVDPSQWMARERNGRLHFNYEYRQQAYRVYNAYRFSPCQNNPHYRVFLDLVAREIARVGYDGVFVDNCNLNCYCEHCQAKFKEYLAARYTTDELTRRFGVGDPAQLELGWRGSRMEWVKNEPSFKEFLADRYTEEELIRWLGTANMDEAQVEEGGNGWLWGRARDYRRWMEQRYTPRELERMFGAPDLSQWGLRSPEDRALWAETKLFWGQSIQDNLAYIKRVGSEVRGDFYLLPNWGQMQTPDSTEFREEIAHIVESWAPAFDSMMYEEDGDAGRVAHGFYLDHFLEYKLALALGAASGILAYGSGHEAGEELSMAQALASGNGSYIQLGPRFPQLRARHRAFIDDNQELLAGLRSHADIALGCFFRELHMENHAHYRQVYQFMRYLTEQHTLFDLVVEKQLTPQVLRDYRALILPSVRYLSDTEVAAVSEFAAAGGMVVLTGDAGGYDDAGKPRAVNAFAGLLQGGRSVTGIRVARAGLTLHALQPAALIGADRVSREDALAFAMYSARSLNVPGGRSVVAAYELDRVVGVSRYYEPAALIPRIERALGHRVRLAEGRKVAGVCFQAYRKPGLIVLHALNYNVPVLENPRGRTVEPVEGLRVTLPLPDGFQVHEVALREVGGGWQVVTHRISRGAVRLTIPHLRIHQMAVVR